MKENFGSDFLSITDEDGVDYELEVLMSLEYNGYRYLAVIPADTDENQLRPEVMIFKSIEEDGEAILCVIEDEQELNNVNELMMDELFRDEDTN